MGLSKAEEKEVFELLRQSRLFRYCTEKDVQRFVKSFTKEQHPQGAMLMEQGSNAHKMFLVADGMVERQRVEDDRMHFLDQSDFGVSINSLHVLRRDPAYATSLCKTDVVAYTVTVDGFKKFLAANPQFSEDVIYGLMREVRSITRGMSTPLLEQKSAPIPFFATSVAASIESFYRSALNALINQALTGHRAAYFPNMHIQLPTRVMYINGFKGLRQFFDTTVKPADYSNPEAVRLGLAVLPGLIMTPISSVLEACNAGHANPEPLHRRLFRGYVPRCGREVIFGVGLNNLSDYCEERMYFINHDGLKNAVGSVAAGVCAGYLSHVPHNLSTMKLMEPHKTYKEHFSNFAKHSEGRIPASIKNPSMRRTLASIMAVVLPKGVGVRTTQIVGSFILLNGTIHALKNYSLQDIIFPTPKLGPSAGAADRATRG